MVLRLTSSGIIVLITSWHALLIMKFAIDVANDWLAFEDRNRSDDWCIADKTMVVDDRKSSCSSKSTMV